MSSNLVYLVESGKDFDKIKDSLSKKYKLIAINNKPEHVQDTFQLITEGGKIRFTLFKNKKLMIQGSPSSHSFISIKEIIEKDSNFKSLNKKAVDEKNIIDLSYIDKKYFIGLDESGVGETCGSMFLCMGVFEKNDMFKLLEKIDVKDIKSLNIENVLSLYNITKSFFKREIEMIPPYKIDIENKINLLDKGYIKLLKSRKDVLTDSCIILDDYGIGKEFKSYAKKLENVGTIFIITHKADKNYLPAMIASLIARKSRLQEMESISESNILMDPISKEIIKIKSCSPSDPITEKWLIAYRRLNPYEDFPNFVRKKWSNVKAIETKYPKINRKHLFRCNSCGSTINRVYLKYNCITKKTELLCSKEECKKLIDKKQFNRIIKDIPIVLDTSALISRTLSKDLMSSRYFENTKIIVPSCLYEEIDSKEPDKKKGAENEIAYLREATATDILNHLKLDDSEFWSKDIPMDQILISIIAQKKAAILTKDRTQSMFSHAASFVIQIVQ